MSKAWITLVSVMIVVSKTGAGLICVFFQAEDGIRDAQESRGLGDVYKRQIYNEGGMYSPDGSTRTFDANGKGTSFSDGVGIIAVSYTHLTLPTIYAV